MRPMTAVLILVVFGLFDVVGAHMLALSPRPDGDYALHWTNRRGTYQQDVPIHIVTQDADSIVMTLPDGGQYPFTRVSGGGWTSPTFTATGDVLCSNGRYVDGVEYYEISDNFKRLWLNTNPVDCGDGMTDVDTSVADIVPIVTAN